MGEGMGENIADLGGVKLSLAAFHKELAGHPEARAGGAFTDDQLFFLGFAQASCMSLRPEEVRLRASFDPHSAAIGQIGPHLQQRKPVE
jgi:putative endopeptidase